MIAYEDGGVKNTIPYHVKDLEGGIYPQLGDKVLLDNVFLVVHEIVDFLERIMQHINCCVALM